jgi:hypothetical protein
MVDLYPSENLNAWNLLSVRHFAYKLLFHVHLPRFGDILIVTIPVSTFTIDLVFENCFLSTMAPYVYSRDGRSLSIYGSECQIWKTLLLYAKRKLKYSLSENFNLLPYVEWDRFVTLTGAQAEWGLRIVSSLFTAQNTIHLEFNFSLLISNRINYVVLTVLM